MLHLQVLLLPGPYQGPAAGLLRGPQAPPPVGQEGAPGLLPPLLLACFYHPRLVQNSAAGFKQHVAKLSVTVDLLLGNIPERQTFVVSEVGPALCTSPTGPTRLHIAQTCLDLSDQ